jgi:hypothetical protein
LFIKSVSSSEETDTAELDIAEDTEDAGFTELEEETASAEELDSETVRLEDSPETGMLIPFPESILALVPDESSEQAERPKVKASAQEVTIDPANHFFFIIKLLFAGEPAHHGNLQKKIPTLVGMTLRSGYVH